MARMQAKEGFSGVLDNGISITAQGGETFPDTHPAVKKWPELFVPSFSRHDADIEPEMEEATAEPGRKRGKG